jgi:hypothetical protein
LLLCNGALGYGLWVVHHDGFVYAVAGISATLKWLGIGLFLLCAMFALMRRKR